MTLSPARPAPDRRRTTGRSAFPSAFFLFLAAALIIGAVDVVVVPLLLREQATDWVAYDEAARALAAHEPLYRWTVDPDVRAVTAYPYLYPPPLAAIWGLGLTATAFALLKVLSLATLGGFARPLLTGAAPRVAMAAAAGLVALAVTSPPVLHDLVLGNVMTLYLAATALALALPDRRWAAVPLGALIAIALKPTIVPVLIWLAIRRRSQFVGAFAAGVVTTAIFAVLLGIDPFLEYAAAVPKLGGLAQPFTGNLGLSGISLPLAVLAIPVALVWVAWAARSIDPWASAAVAASMTQLAQPSLGLNYAALLIPGVIALWFVDRRACLVAAVLVPLVSLPSPPAAGVMLALIATFVGRRAAPASATSVGAVAT